MEISSGDLCKYGYLEKKKQTMTRGIFGFREKAPHYRRPVRPGSLFGSRLSRASTSPASPVLPTSGMPGSWSARRTLEAAGICTGALHCKARGPRCRGLGSCNLTQAPPTIPVVSVTAFPTVALSLPSRAWNLLVCPQRPRSSGLGHPCPPRASQALAAGRHAVKSGGN